MRLYLQFTTKKYYCNIINCRTEYSFWGIRLRNQIVADFLKRERIVASKYSPYFIGNGHLGNRFSSGVLWRLENREKKHFLRTVLYLNWFWCRKRDVSCSSAGKEIQEREKEGKVFKVGKFVFNCYGGCNNSSMVFGCPGSESWNQSIVDFSRAFENLMLAF